MLMAWISAIRCLNRVASTSSSTSRYRKVPSSVTRAVPVFRRMLASHQRSLNAAHEHKEPAGQIASRELEIVRIKGALQRAEELSDDAAAAIERDLLSRAPAVRQRRMEE
jgi:hypothetical protein